MDSTHVKAQTKIGQKSREGVPAKSGSAFPALSATGLSKKFKRSDNEIVSALDDVNLSVAQGEIVVLLGPSGCGKTTLLRAVAGLERPDAGVINVDGREVFSAHGDASVFVPSEHRNLSMMFQSYALWPHMTVSANVAYPLRRRKVKKAEAHERARLSLIRNGIGGLDDEFPHHLSGGQQQRVALTRAVIAESPLVLFDEPLSNVDAKVRTELRSELISLQAKLGFAALYVTHDQAEAMEMGHRIAVMNNGRIDQLGSARDIYERPMSRYVANFVGAVNEVEGTVGEIDAAALRVETSLGSITVQRGEQTAFNVGDRVVLLFRPEWVDVSLGRQDGSGIIAEVERHLYLGAHAEIFCRVGDTRIQVRIAPDHEVTAGDTVSLAIPADRVQILPLE